MATYKGINGFAVQSVASDPSPLDEGQVWYNNATYAFKLATVTTSGTWASGGNLNTARSYVSGTGTATAGLAYSSAQSPYNQSESYNGTSWTNTSDLNSGSYGKSGAGTLTATVTTGGYDFPNTSEKFNGTSWTTGNSLNSSLVYRGCFGVQTAAIAAAGGSTGVPSGTGLSSTVESYNGTSWTVSPSTVNSARRLNQGSAGISTAGLIFGGYAPSPVFFDDSSTATESYNGTSWTSVNAMNTGRRLAAGFGSQTLAVTSGGYGPNGAGSPQLSSAETWNGTSWASAASMPASTGGAAGLGSFSSGLSAGGQSPNTAATYVWTGPGSPTTRTITTS